MLALRPRVRVTPRAYEIMQKVDRGDTLTKGENFEYREMLQQQSTLEFSLKELLIYGIILKLMKTPEGLEVLKALGKEFIKGMFDTLHALGQASSANKVSSWANPWIVSLVLERFGFIRPEQLGRLQLGLSVITGATVAEGFLDTIQGFFPFSSPEPSEYPTNVVFSARDTNGTIERRVEAKGFSVEQLEQLRQLTEKK